MELITLWLSFYKVSSRILVFSSADVIWHLLKFHEIHTQQDQQIVNLELFGLNSVPRKNSAIVIEVSGYLGTVLGPAYWKDQSHCICPISWSVETPNDDHILFFIVSSKMHLKEPRLVLLFITGVGLF